MDAGGTGTRRNAAIAGLALIAFAGCSTTSVRSDEPAPTTHGIFDGKSLRGWVQRGGAAVYRVEDGVIIGETRPNQPNTFLCTEKEYSDFILELEFKVDPALNSGVQVRSHARPQGELERVFGYQVEIDPSDRAWTAGIYDEARRGWLVNPSEQARGAFRQRDWNSLRVEARGTQLRTWLNGVPAALLVDGMDASGFIALQVHGVGPRTEPLTIMWRSLKLTELNPGPVAGP